MDENANQNNNNPPSQRDASSRRINRRNVARIGATIAAGPLGLPVLEGGGIAVKNAISSRRASNISAPPTPEAPSTESSETADAADQFVRDLPSPNSAPESPSEKQLAHPTGLAPSQQNALKRRLKSRNAARVGGLILGGPIGLAATENAIRMKQNRDKNKLENTETDGKQILMYSSGGFLNGKIMSRIKERFFARKKTQEVESEAGKEQADNIQKSHEKQNAAKNKKVKKAGVFTAKGIFYTSPAGWAYFLGKKYLPQSVKTRLRKIFPKGVTSQTENKTQKQKKTAKDYQRVWINSTLGKAFQKGYDRFALLRKVRDMKIWKSRAWKYGKYVAFGPVGGAAIDAYRWKQDRKEELRDTGKRQQQSNAPSVGQIRRVLEGDESMSMLSPRSIGGKVWNRFATPRLSGLNRRLGQKLGGRMGQNVARNAGKKAAQQIGKQIAKAAVKQAVTEGAVALLANPVSLVVIGVVLAILLFIAIIIFVILNAASGGDNSQDFGAVPAPPPPVNGSPPSANPIPNFTITKTVEKQQYTYPEPITFTITYSYTPATGTTIQLSDITIYDKLPDNVSYVSSPGTVIFDASTNTVSWKLSDLNNTSPISLVVTPKQDNILISNSAFATATSTSSGGGGETPTSDNCNGIYNLTNPIGNFGDPTCYFASNKAQAMSDLYDLLIAQDPANADGWYYKVASCETGGTYSPNAYRPHHVDGADDTPDPNGAWGLFQMSMNNYNGQYDLGAVPWQDQVTNAVGYGKRVTASGQPLGAYWWCWR